MKQLKTMRAWAKQAIQESGLRATPARVATLVALHESKSPLTHAEVAILLAEHGIDKATVFRNLNDMVSASLVRRTELGDHVWRFEFIAKDEQGHPSHPHFICVDCGSVSCLQEIKLTNKSMASSKRFGEITEILLRGYCHNCV